MGSSKSKPALNTSEMKYFFFFLFFIVELIRSIYLGKTNEEADVQQTTLVKSQTVEPLRMPIQQTFACDRCGMIFPSDDMLFKHKAQYCVGGRDPAYANDQFHTSNKTDPSTNSHRTPATKVKKMNEEFLKFIRTDFYRK